MKFIKEWINEAVKKEIVSIEKLNEENWEKDRDMRIKHQDAILNHSAQIERYLSNLEQILEKVVDKL